MIDKWIKRGALIRVKSTGRIAVLGVVQEVHNRYQLPTLSGWQYGINDLEYMDSDAIISTIEGLKGEAKQIQHEKNYDSLIWNNKVNVAEAEAERYRKALEYYADKNVYKQDEKYMCDNGEIARKALGDSHD